LLKQETLEGQEEIQKKASENQETGKANTWGGRWGTKKPEAP